MLKKLFVFDVETIPDTDVVFNLTGSENKDILTLRKELEDYHIKISNGNPFPRQLFHRVVTISILIADIVSYNGYEKYENIKITTLSSSRNTEKEIIEKFFSFISKHIPKIVSYNGRSFDLPVLKYRAMKYGISLEGLFKSGDKWNSYNQRYSSDWHCDLLEVLSDFGASSRIKMNEVCTILGLPGKIGVDGSQVAGLYDENKLNIIDDYCETDILNTYLIYLNYAHLTGIINREIFNDCNLELIEFLKNAEKDNFFEFLNAWEEVDSRKLFI